MGDSRFRRIRCPEIAYYFNLDPSVLNLTACSCQFLPLPLHDRLCRGWGIQRDLWLCLTVYMIDMIAAWFVMSVRCHASSPVMDYLVQVMDYCFPLRLLCMPKPNFSLTSEPRFVAITVEKHILLVMDTTCRRSTLSMQPIAPQTAVDGNPLVGRCMCVSECRCRCV